MEDLGTAADWAADLDTVVGSAAAADSASGLASAWASGSALGQVVAPVPVVQLAAADVSVACRGAPSPFNTCMRARPLLRAYS